MTSMGLQRDYPTRFFRREGSHYDGRAVHEGLSIAQNRLPIGQLEQALEHHTLESIDHYLRKIDLYTSLELAHGNRRFSMFHMIFVLPSTFWRYYLARGGYRDGMPGLIWAGLSATGYFLRDMKLWIREQELGS